MDTKTFANTIRQKYPDGVAKDGVAYKDMPDEELTHRVVTKYPVYRDQVTDYKAPDTSFIGALTGQNMPTAKENQQIEVQGGTSETNYLAQAIKHPIETGKGALKGIPGGAASVTEGLDVLSTKLSETIPEGLQPSGLQTLTEARKALGKETGETTLDYTDVEELTTPSNKAQEVGYGGVQLLPVERAFTAGKPLVEGVSKMIKPTVSKIAEKQAVKQVAKKEQGILKTIIGKDEEMSKAMKEEAITQGRKVESKGLLGTQKVEYTPAEEIQHAAKILSKESDIKTGEVPTIVRDKVKKVIAKRGQEAEQYLAQNAKPITNQEHATLFDTLKQEASLRDDRKAAVDAYDSLIDNFTKRLVGKGGFTTENYYKALKEWEADIADTLPKGKEALLDATGVSSGRVRAATDIRKAVRDVIATKNPEFKQKMYDLMSLYRAKDQAMYNALKFEGKGFFDAHPNLKKAGQWAAGGATVAGGATFLMK